MNQSKIPLLGLVVVSLGALALFIIFNNQAILSPTADHQLASVGTLGPGTTYYVDNSHASSSDDNLGTDQDAPWKTISKVNEAMGNFKPGDNILFKRGGTWTEKLTVQKSGSSGTSITIGAYGEGGNPIIDLGNQSDFGILVLDQNYVNIQDLTIKNAKSDNGPSAGIAIANSKNITIDTVEIVDTKGVGGIFIYASGPNLLSGITVRNSKIDNTTGTTYSIGGGNNGTGIQIWGDCTSCGSNVVIENNTITGSAAHGIGVFMPFVTIRGNSVSNNGEAGIGGGGLAAHDLVIDDNKVSSNCQKKDDCFGINMFRTGGKNIIKNNTLSGQHDTLSDKNIPINPGYPNKYGTGGIRFDGGDKTLVTLAEFGPGSDYMDQAGNSISGNTISNEYDGIQIFNYNNVSITGNNIKNSGRAAVNAAADNTDGKSITVTIQNNTFEGNGVLATNTTILGDSPAPTPPPTATTTPTSTPPITCTTPKTYYEDKDADTYGNPNVKKSSCTQPVGYVLSNKDCNDTVKATRRCLSCSVRNSSTCRK